MTKGKTSQLQNELKQNRPFRSKGHEAVVGLAHTADVLRRRGAAMLAAHDLTPQQYNVLRILRGAGEAGLPTLEIAGRMIEQAPGITRLIDRLERGGRVRRTRGKGDRRQVQVRATPAALALLEKLDPVINAFERACVAMLSQRELAVLIDLLDRLRAG